jgi:preprotein translocase subunit SecA
VIFEQRIELMHKDEVGETVADMRREVVDELVAAHIPPNAYAEQWDTAGLQDAVKDTFGLELPVVEWAKEEGIADQEIRERLINQVDSTAARKAAEIGPELMRHIEKEVLLRTLDMLWREHIINLEHLRQGVGLRGYAQRDPLNEYKSESFTMFESMLARLRVATTEQLMHVHLAPNTEMDLLQAPQLPEMFAHHADPLTGEDDFLIEEEQATGTDGRPTMRKGAGGPGRGGNSAKRPQPRARVAAAPAAVIDPNDSSTWGKVSRNASCPCGSGKKFKHCHGALVAS